MADENKTGKAAGGYARADALSADVRSQIAKQAATARWKSPIARATHGSADHPLRIGDIEIPCYVLADGTRVLSQRGLRTGIGMSHSGGSKTGEPRLVALFESLTSKGLETKQLAARIRSPIRFYPPGGGRDAYGFEATILADICDVILAARKGEYLQPQQMHIAERCEILVRGFALIGIIALVDEATGYQEVRDRLALQEILELYLRKEVAAWVKRFPDEFYRQIYRLRGWEWRGMAANRISACAQYTKDLIYDRIAPGLLHELETRNPVAENGTRKSKHHQLLTEDIGIPKLAEHFGSVVTLEKISKTWDEFYSLMNQFHPRRGDTLQLDFDGPISPNESAQPSSQSPNAA